MPVASWTYRGVTDTGWTGGNDFSTYFEQTLDFTGSTTAAGGRSTTVGTGFTSTGEAGHGTTQFDRVTTGHTAALTDATAALLESSISTHHSGATVRGLTHYTTAFTESGTTDNGSATTGTATGFTDAAPATTTNDQTTTTDSETYEANAMQGVAIEPFVQCGTQQIFYDKTTWNANGANTDDQTVEWKTTTGGGNYGTGVNGSVFQGLKYTGLLLDPTPEGFGGAESAEGYILRRISTDGFGVLSQLAGAAETGTAILCETELWRHTTFNLKTTKINQTDAWADSDWGTVAASTLTELPWATTAKTWAQWGAGTTVEASFTELAAYPVRPSYHNGLQSYTVPAELTVFRTYERVTTYDLGGQGIETEGGAYNRAGVATFHGVSSYLTTYAKTTFVDGFSQLLRSMSETGSTGGQSETFVKDEAAGGTSNWRQSVGYYPVQVGDSTRDFTVAVAWPRPGILPIGDTTGAPFLSLSASSPGGADTPLGGWNLSMFGVPVHDYGDALFLAGPSVLIDGDCPLRTPWANGTILSDSTNSTAFTLRVTEAYGASLESTTTHDHSFTLISQATGGVSRTVTMDGSDWLGWDGGVDGSTPRSLYMPEGAYTLWRGSASSTTGAQFAPWSTTFDGAQHLSVELGPAYYAIQRVTDTPGYVLVNNRFHPGMIPG